MKNRVGVLFFSIVFLCMSTVVFSLEGFDFGDIDDTEETNETDAAEELGSRRTDLPLFGTVSFTGAYQLDEPNRLSELGPVVYAQYDQYGKLGQIYCEGSLKYNSAYRIEEDPGETIREYEFHGVLRELFWRYSSGPVTMTGGKIITSWSVMDLLPVTNRISIKDRSLEYFKDPADTVLGQLSINVDFYITQGMINLMLIPYPLFNSVADKDHPYSVLPGYTLHKEDEWRDPGFAGRFQLNNNSGHVAFLAGKLYNRDPIINTKIISMTEVEFNALYDSSWFAGLTCNAATGFILWKAEAVYDFYRPRQTMVNGFPAGIEYCDGFQFTGGLDINAGLLGNLTGEVTGEIIISGGDSLAAEEYTFTSAYRWNKTMWNNRVTANAMVIFPVDWENIILRGGISWDIINNLNASVNYTGFFIETDKAPYARVDNYDRIDITLSYSFSF